MIVVDMVIVAANIDRAEQRRLEEKLSPLVTIANAEYVMLSLLSPLILLVLLIKPWYGI
jgi:hypothetical protein